jgi:hypothetical protein
MAQTWPYRRAVLPNWGESIRHCRPSHDGIQFPLNRGGRAVHSPLDRLRMPVSGWTRGIRRGHQTAIAGVRSLRKDLGTNPLSIEYSDLGGEKRDVEGGDHV